MNLLNKVKGEKSTLLLTGNYNKEKFKKDFFAWLLCVPALAVLTFYVIMPLIGTVQMAFSETKGFQIVGFNGLENFRIVMKHPQFWKALKNSAMYVVWNIVLGMFTPIIFAGLLAEIGRGRSFFRVISRIPGMLPGVATLTILSFFFRADSLGVLNNIITSLGFEKVRFLTDKEMVIFWLVLCSVWQGLGGTALLYMASMADISPELYEAAAIAGANPLQRFWYITIPSIKGQFKLLAILHIIGSFQVLQEPLVMTGGGPNNASLSIMLLVYRYAFEDNRLGLANALSLILSVVLIALSVLLFSVQKKTDQD